MMSKWTWRVYCLLALAWVIVGAWQVYEHERFQESVQEALFNRANDISNTLAVVIRSQGRFGVAYKPYLDATLAALTESEDLRSVALLDTTGAITASAGEPIVIDLEDLAQVGTHWDRETITFLNLVALGEEGDSLDDASRMPALMAPRDADDSRKRDRLYEKRGRGGEDRDRRHWSRRADADDDGALTFAEAVAADPGLTREAFNMHDSNGDGSWSPSDGFAPPGFRRPPWMKRVDYEQLLTKQGVHWFVLAVSREPFQSENLRDFELRIGIVAIALVAMLALGAAWHSLERSTRLRIRLARTDEMNTHLKNMNLAAAGLAHETRNPLNVVRGLAQIIHQHEDTPEAMRHKARDITEEVDQVTERLNQFMGYSKPLEVAPAPTNLNRVIEDVMRVLEADRDYKSVTFSLNGPALSVQADAPMLRQVLFNLLLNALQAVPEGGRVDVSVAKQGQHLAAVDVIDNGPGVPEDIREDVFQPYFTIAEGGTGLGLAVVRQIVLAHQWNIECRPSPSGGAIFRVDGLNTV